MPVEVVTNLQFVRVGVKKTIASIHLAANIPNFVILEAFQDYDVAWRESLTKGMPQVKTGYYEVPAASGWGLEVNEAALAEHPEDPDAKLKMFSADWEERMCR